MTDPLKGEVMSTNLIPIDTEFLKLYQEVKTGGRFNRVPERANTKEEEKKQFKNNDKKVVRKHRNTPSK